VSLRARLVAVLLMVAVLGLAVAGSATFVLQRSFLLDRVDEQLDDARIPARTALLADAADDAAAGAGNSARRSLPSGAYAEVRNRNGSTRINATYSLSGDSDAAPALPDQLPGSGAAGSRERFTAGAVEGGGDFRVLAESLPRGGTLIVAMPLDEVHDTLRRLLVAEILVAAAVVGALSAMSWWLVGVGLRPLRRISQTAGAIADGDIGRRVPDADERTEVGRLGASINTMLARIEQAMNERQASEDRLRRFVSDASHELRTPLTSIRGYAELFRRGADQRPEDLATAMRRIEEESGRMGRLVDDLLLLARLDESPAVERRPVDLATVASDAAADARATQPERSIIVDAPAGGAVVLGDEARLRQAVANLVGNALTHTSFDATVTIRVVATTAAVTLEVSDTGLGLDDATAARAFDRFHRGDESRSPGGTGLGLAIVKAVAEAHGGTVGVRSESGHGATFTLTLPR